MFAFTKLMQAMVASGTVSDPQFYLTTLLLNTSSTNGAQNNTFLDSSSSPLTITRNGNVTQGTFTPFSQTGWSNYFNGSSYLTIADNATLELGTSDFTMEWWCLPTSFSSNQFQLAKCATSATTAGFLTYIDTSGILHFNANSVSGWDIANNQGTLALTLNAWNHIAISRSGSSWRIWINGASSATFTSSLGVQNTTTAYSIAGAADGSAPFTGNISNARIVIGSAVYSPSSSTITVPITPLTAVSGTQLLTCQSNRFLDNSVNTFPVTVNGTPSVQAFSPFLPTAAYDTAVVGGSGYFDGSSDYLQAPNNAAFQFSGAFTIEMWVYPTQVTARADLVTTPTSGSSASGIFFFINSSAAPFFGSGAASFITSSKTVSPNTWTHLALTRDGSNVATIWVNGVSGGTATVTQNFSDGNLYVGTENALGNYFQGYMSSVRVVKGTAVYTTTFTPPTAPLTAVTNTSLLLNFTNAGIYDSASKNVLETVGNAQVSTTQAKWGTTSMAFDGTGDWLVMPSSQSFAFGTGNFTVEFWVYYSSASANYQFIDARGTSYTNGGFALYTTGGSIYVQYGSTALVTATAPSANTWHHIAATRSGTSTKLFIDGTQAGSTATDSNSYGAYQTFIGQFGGGSGYDLNGYIDDLRVTKGYARYTANFTPPTAAFGTQ